jgi:hypothetical protein
MVVFQKSYVLFMPLALMERAPAATVFGAVLQVDMALLLGGAADLRAVASLPCGAGKTRVGRVSHQA